MPGEKRSISRPALAASARAARVGDPCFRLAEPPANPKRQQAPASANRKAPSPAQPWVVDDKSPGGNRQVGSKDTGAMKDRARPGPRSRRENLGHHRAGHGPFAPHAQRHQKPQDHDVDPRFGKGGQAGEERVHQNGNHHRPGPADAIAQSAKHYAAQRTASEKSAQSNVVVKLACRLCRSFGQERRHRFIHAGDEDLPFEYIENPTQRSDCQHEPLVAGDAGVPRRPPPRNLGPCPRRRHGECFHDP